MGVCPSSDPNLFPNQNPIYFQVCCRGASTLEPISHFFYSDRLKLQFWDYGQDNKPALVLVHGALDHARNWDWVAQALREHYHVYALDLRGHGNSAWAPGAPYTVAEHVLDLSALLDVINDFPDSPGRPLSGRRHCADYAGVYPERVRKLVSIEGLGFPSGASYARPCLRAPTRVGRKYSESREAPSQKLSQPQRRDGPHA